jgi:hypothetical protein
VLDADPNYALNVRWQFSWPFVKHNLVLALNVQRAADNIRVNYSLVALAMELPLAPADK